MAALKNLSQFSVLLLSAGSGTRLGSKGKKTFDGKECKACGYKKKE